MNIPLHTRLESSLNLKAKLTNTWMEAGAMHRRPNGTADYLGKKMVSSRPEPTRVFSKAELAAMSPEQRLMCEVFSPQPSEREREEALKHEDDLARYHATGDVVVGSRLYDNGPD